MKLVKNTSDSRVYKKTKEVCKPSCLPKQRGKYQIIWSIIVFMIIPQIISALVAHSIISVINKYVLTPRVVLKELEPNPNSLDYNGVGVDVGGSGLPPSTFKEYSQEA